MNYLIEKRNKFVLAFVVGAFVFVPSGFVNAQYSYSSPSTGGYSYSSPSYSSGGYSYSSPSYKSSSSGYSYSSPSKGYSYSSPSYKSSSSGYSYSSPSKGYSYSSPSVGYSYSSPSVGYSYSSPSTGYSYSSPSTGYSYSSPSVGYSYSSPSVGYSYSSPSTGYSYSSPSYTTSTGYGNRGISYVNPGYGGSGISYGCTSCGGSGGGSVVNNNVRNNVNNSVTNNTTNNNNSNATAAATGGNASSQSDNNSINYINIGDLGGNNNNDDLDVVCRVSDSSIEEGDRVTFTADVDGGDSPYDYDWSGDTEGVDRNDDQITVRYRDNGTYTVRVRVTDDNGDTASDTCTVDVDDDGIRVITSGTPNGQLASLSSVYLSQVPYTGPEEIMKGIGFVAGILMFSALVVYLLTSNRRKKKITAKLSEFKNSNRVAKQII